MSRSKTLRSIERALRNIEKMTRIVFILLKKIHKPGEITRITRCKEDNIITIRWEMGRQPLGRA